MTLRTQRWLIVGGGYGWWIRRIFCSVAGHIPDPQQFGETWCQRRCGYKY